MHISLFHLKPGPHSQPYPSGWFLQRGKVQQDFWQDVFPQSENTLHLKINITDNKYLLFSQNNILQRISKLLTIKLQQFHYFEILSIFCFEVSVLSINVCPCFLFLLVIVLSVLLRITASDHHLGIFWSLCCLSFFGLRLLITTWVCFGHYVVCPSSVYSF